MASSPDFLSLSDCVGLSKFFEEIAIFCLICLFLELCLEMLLYLVLCNQILVECDIAVYKRNGRIILW